MGLPDLKELELSTNIKPVDDPNDVCAICLDDFYDRSNITCQLNCKHFYHVECLKKQRKVSVNPIRDKCPMCRISYDTVVQQVYVEKPKKKQQKKVFGNTKTGGEKMNIVHCTYNLAQP